MTIKEKIFLSAYFSVFLTFSMLGIIFYANGTNRNLSEIVLMPLLGILLITIMGIIKMRYHFPILLEALIVIFLFSSIILGNFFNFYDKLRYWDDFLHILSSLFIALIGFSIIISIEGTKHLRTIILFSFFFAMGILAIWEILEYGIDMFGGNSQNYLNIDLTPKMGREALKDTMTDLIVDLFSSALGTLIGYIFLDKGMLDLIRFKKTKNLFLR